MSTTSGVRREAFIDADDYARTVHEAGEPDLSSPAGFAFGTGPYAELLRAVWGASPGDWERATEAEYPDV